MLLKYSGISFISGAVNHGFFSGERSLWTAAIGIVLFVVGAWMEHRSQDSNTSLFESLWVGTLLSIGLGFFTGGLQHFPDSPARSSWVVPLGFAVSIFALVFSLQMRVNRALVVYSLGLGILVSVSSWAAYQAFEKTLSGQQAVIHMAKLNQIQQWLMVKKKHTQHLLSLAASTST